MRDRVTVALRAAIISGAMEPGQIYSAPELAAEFGVSATPVREGMLDLVKEGLVVPVPNRGFLVTEMSEAELDDLADLRQIIEPIALRRSAPSLTVTDLDALAEIADTIVAQAKAQDLISYLDADLLFHQRLLAHSSNARMLDLISLLRGQARLYGLTKLAAEGLLAETASEHITMVELLRDGKIDETVELLHRHIGHSRDVWSSRVPPRQSPNP